jgi:hypothetical protein
LARLVLDLETLDLETAWFKSSRAAPRSPLRLLTLAWLM